jgi:hypothetical protein
MNYAARNANILGRTDRYAAHPSAAALRKASEAFLGVSERFSREREQIDQNPHLTGQGKNAKLIDSLRNVRARIFGTLSSRLMRSKRISKRCATLSSR